MTKAMKEFAQGFRFALDGVKLIFQVPGLKMWALIPFLIDLALVIWGVALGLEFVGIWVAAALGYVFSTPVGWFYTILYYPLFAIFWVMFLGLVIYGIFLLATIIASPFNSVIAEKVLVHTGALQERPFSVRRWLATTVRMLAVSLVRAAIFAVIGVVIFVLSFVPVVNLLAGFLAFLIIAFDCSDYALEAKEMALRARFQFFKDQFAYFAGMASFLGLTLLVPGLTLLFLPSSVAGSAAIVGRITGRGGDQ